MQITVIGAGVVGLAIAYELASRGAAVRILDARGPGQGATWASAGILAPHIEGHSDALLRLSVASLEAYDSFIDRVTVDSDQLIEYQRNGTLQVALNAEQSARLPGAAERLAAAQVKHELLDADAARRLEPALGDIAVGAVRAGARLRRRSLPGVGARGGAGRAGRDHCAKARCRISRPRPSAPMR